MATLKTKVVAGTAASAAVLLGLIMAGVHNAEEATMRAAVADRFAQRNVDPITIQERDDWIDLVNAQIKRCGTLKIEGANTEAILDAMNGLVRNGC